MKKKFVQTVLTAAITFTLFSAVAQADYYTDQSVLYQGMSNPDVTQLQKDLSHLGYFEAPVTGNFGSATKQSVINYQLLNNLSPDGIVGHITAREIKIDNIIQTANHCLGVPYVWGGTSLAGLDCSGFTQYVFKQNSIMLPRTASLQFKEGYGVSKANLRVGDLVFFSTYKPGASHVGIFLGNHKFIEASSGSGKIIVDNLQSTYWVPRYIGARRIIS